jgi:hypothetical protein
VRKKRWGDAVLKRWENEEMTRWGDGGMGGISLLNFVAFFTAIAVLFTATLHKKASA